MGRVEFGAQIREKDGKEFFIPEIMIMAGDEEDNATIRFVSNIIFDTPEEVEEFCHHVYQILTGPKNNIQAYPGGSHGSGHLN